MDEQQGNGEGMDKIASQESYGRSEMDSIGVASWWVCHVVADMLY